MTRMSLRRLAPQRRVPCEETSIELWYGPPEPDDGGYVEPPDQRRWRERRALQYCESCSVRATLEAELRRPAHHQWGVRGGMTERERRALIRARLRAQADQAVS
ncbi:WhiB family transcriptional regulator [Actinopolymorpha sp. B17G11]|uniref:WhiB family transcriptional regulator n=1 Tax=Actinopolymorpha sp. B17G11 TaxID=3160861 RepID=UPI0032E51C3E